MAEYINEPFNSPLTILCCHIAVQITDEALEVAQEVSFDSLKVGMLNGQDQAPQSQNQKASPFQSPQWAKAASIWAGVTGCPSYHSCDTSL